MLHDIGSSTRSRKGRDHLLAALQGGYNLLHDIGSSARSRKGRDHLLAALQGGHNLLQQQLACWRHRSVWSKGAWSDCYSVNGLEGEGLEFRGLFITFNFTININLWGASL